MIYTLYNLIDNKTFEPFYVGITSQLKYREQKHKYRFGKSKFIFKEITSCIGKELAVELETLKIKEYKDLGYFLLNKNNGGNNPPSQKGVVFSNERKKLSFETSALKKAVLQIDKVGNIVNEFEGVRDAYRQTGIDYRSISQVAAGSKIRKTAGGFLWEYKKGAKK